MVAYTLMDNGIVCYESMLRLDGTLGDCMRSIPFTPAPGRPLQEQVDEAARKAPLGKGRGGYLLRQVRRNSDGLLGGYVEAPECLSQEGTCFVHDSAQVWAEGRVSGNAQVHGDAVVFGTVEDDVVVVGGNVEGRLSGRMRVERAQVPRWDWWKSGLHPWADAETAAHTLYCWTYGGPPTPPRLEYWTERVRMFLEQRGLRTVDDGALLGKALEPLQQTMRLTLEDQVVRRFPPLSPAEFERVLGVCRDALSTPPMEAERGSEDAASWMESCVTWLCAYLYPKEHPRTQELAGMTRDAFRSVLGRDPSSAELGALVLYWRDHGGLVRDYVARVRAALGQPPPPPPPEPVQQRVPTSENPAELVATLLFNMGANAHARGMLDSPQLHSLVEQARSTLGAVPALDGLVKDLENLAATPPPSSQARGPKPRPPVRYPAMPRPNSPAELLANLRAVSQA